LASVLGSGFGGYALLLYLLSAVAFCVCPCLGAAGAAGTTAIWALLWAIELALFSVTSYVAAVLSLISVIRLSADKVTPRPLVWTNFIIHSVIAAIAATLIGFDWISALL
jgi:hypothetical protein